MPPCKTLHNPQSLYFLASLFLSPFVARLHHLLRRQAATLVDHADGTCSDVSNGRYLRVSRTPTHTRNKPFYFLSVCCGYHLFYILSLFIKLWVSLANATYCLAIRIVPCTIRLRDPRWIHPDQLLLPAGGSRQCVLVFRIFFPAHLLHILISNKNPFFSSKK